MLYNLLRKSAQNYPDNIAAEDKSGTITYKELYNISQVIGKSISAKFQSNNGVIGILMDKSIDYLSSIFGVLFTQNAYVPLDQGMPIDRLKYILRNAGISYLITDSKHYNLACEICDQSNVLLFNRTEFSNQEIEGYDTNNVSGSEESLAYILYTSGSTGFPKGIMHTHRSAHAFIKWATEYFQVKENDVFSSHAPFHFDLSIFDIYVCISVGAKLCILPKSISSFPASLIEFIKVKQITIWYSVPFILVSMFSNANMKEEPFHSLRTIIYAGESMSLQNAMRIKDLQPWTEIYNLYGPTETNVITYYKLDELTSSRSDQEIPIGYPCPYAHIRVLDEHGIEVKNGEIGELVVKSKSLMSGYVDNGRINQNDFEYATGDIVKKESDNLFVFVGRKDYMAKVNGFRVELGDIENNIKKFPNIDDCYVKVKKENGRDIIEVMIDSKDDIDILKLKQFMATKVPGYMLPNNYVVSHNLERNTRGKIIRR